MSPIKIPKWVRLMKLKRPEFVRQESWRYVRLKPNWRRPRGKDSKMRLQRSGWPPLVKIGYRTPKSIGASTQAATRRSWSIGLKIS